VGAGNVDATCVIVGLEQTLAGLPPVVWQIAAVIVFAAPSTVFATGLVGSASAATIWSRVIPCKIPGSYSAPIDTYRFPIIKKGIAPGWLVYGAASNCWNSACCAAVG